MSRKPSRGRGEQQNVSLAKTRRAAQATTMHDPFAQAATAIAVKTNPFGVTTRAPGSTTSSPFGQRAPAQATTGPFAPRQANASKGWGAAGTSSRGGASDRGANRGNNRGTARGSARGTTRGGTLRGRGRGAQLDRRTSAQTGPRNPSQAFSAKKDEINLPPEQRLQLVSYYPLFSTIEQPAITDPRVIA